jgi:hypothetical protein
MVIKVSLNFKGDDLFLSLSIKALLFKNNIKGI